MALLHLCIQCETLNLDYLDQNNEVEIDMKAVNSIADRTQGAFLSGDISQVLELLDEEALQSYSEPLENLPVEKLRAFGEVLKSRELKAATPLLAEFEITENGVKYTVAFWKGSENSWKLLRF